MNGLEVIERLAERPGGRELLDAATAREDLALVGGAVRDLTLGRTPRELDVVVAGDAAELAAELAVRLPGNDGRMPQTTLHGHFRTASVEWSYGRIDIAERRAESYAQPGALPDVRSGTIAEDLARRDFTVNAIAVSLGGSPRGHVDHVPHALEDLAAGQLRVLHERSFRDDPTRLLRLARYQARLRFKVESRTAALAREAIASGALDTVSGGRIAAELWLATEERDADAFALLGALGALAALSLPAQFDASLLREARELEPPDGSSDILEMGILFHAPGEPAADGREAAAQLMERFEFLAETRERVLATAFDSSALADAIERAARPSQLRAALAGEPVEAIALAGALGGRREPEIRERAAAWLGELREVALEIGGADLIAAGIGEGPEIGRRLQRVLDRKLDGELASGRDAELAAAIEAEL